MSNKIKVLLIEDDLVDAEKFVRILADYFDLTTANSIENGLFKNQHNHFDVILLDLGLPDSLSNPEETFKLVENSVDIPIVILTGMSDSFGSKMIQHGAQDYLLKSETSAELCCRSIIYAIERYRSCACNNMDFCTKEIIMIKEAAQKRLTEYDFA